MTDYREVRTTENDSGRQQRVFTFKATQLIWLLVGILEAVIGLRVIFKLLGVNGENPFAAFLYNLTNLFVAPFASLIGAPAAFGMVLEISSIIAMLVYLLVAWGIERIVFVVFYRPRGPVSVRQSVVATHTPPQEVMSTTQTSITERTKI
jgi:hypothetical protein